MVLLVFSNIFLNSYLFFYLKNCSIIIIGDRAGVARTVTEVH